MINKVLDLVKDIVLTIEVQVNLIITLSWGTTEKGHVFSEPCFNEFTFYRQNNQFESHDINIVILKTAL